MKKEYLVSAEEMKQLDDNTINKIGIPSMVLMERASIAVADAVKKYLGNAIAERILVIAGNGNNGADGICAGRILAEQGYRVDIWLLESSHNYSEELLLQKKIADAYNITFLPENDVDFRQYKIVVDAIFGNGLNREVNGHVMDVIEAVNASGAYIISVDIPSGISASTGDVLTTAVKADETITFGFYKCGQFFYPGKEYCGKITKAYIGINETSFYGISPSMYTFMGDLDDKTGLDREPAGNKGTFGKVLIVAGRESTAGAAVLCATSALRSGCGMVAVMTAEENKDAFLATLPEAMIETYSENDAEAGILIKLDKWLLWADVCVIGCGLGRDEIAYCLLSHTIAAFDKPIIADADALQLFAAHEDLRETVCGRKNNKDKMPVIFTPHPGELASLAHCSIADVKSERFKIAESVCMQYGVVLVAKDADTLCIVQGERTYLNSSGNDGMSTAGSGDVLAGLIGSFVARGMRAKRDLFEVVCLAVYVHGLAGDYQAVRNGKSFLVASDIIEAYKYILK